MRYIRKYARKISDKCLRQIPRKVSAVIPGKRLRQLTGMCLRQTPGKRLRQLSEKRLRQLSEKRLRQLSEKRLRQIPGKRLRQLLRIFLEQCKMSLMAASIFRANFILMLFQSILNSLMSVFCVEFIYGSVETIAGWNRDEMIILICTSLVVNQLYRGLVHPNQMRFLGRVLSDIRMIRIFRRNWIR